MTLIKDNIIKTAYDRYNKLIEEKGTIDSTDLFELPTITLLGYILVTNSKTPKMFVSKELLKNNISYEKSKEVRMLLSILDN